MKERRETSFHNHGFLNWKAIEPSPDWTPEFQKRIDILAPHIRQNKYQERLWPNSTSTFFIHLVRIISNYTYVIIFVKYFFKINKIYVLYVSYVHNKINKEQFPPLPWEMQARSLKEENIRLKEKLTRIEKKLTEAVHSSLVFAGRLNVRMYMILHPDSIERSRDKNYSLQSEY